MNKQLVVLIGGPGSGKTTLIEKLIEKGYTCYPEISREITLRAREQGIEQLFLEKPLLFSELLLEGRKKQHEDALTENNDLIFLDRGIPDIPAYMHYIGDSYPSFFDDACKEYRYSKIFFLPPWKEIYIEDEERYENYNQAELIANHLLETYIYYGYKPIEVPKDTPHNRIIFILEQLSN